MLKGESRYSTALAGLGAILGVDRTGTQDEYLEDLRLAAAIMRFDLEACKREVIDDLPHPPLDEDENDGFFPPFEGSPDDNNFGNE